MLKNPSRILILVIAILLIVFTIPALAHEHREVGEYELTFGWRNEPAIVGYPNGPEVYIAHHAEEGEEPEPINFDELEISLQVEVTFGPESRVIDLRGAWGEPGHYIADLIPTRPGDYVFRVFGTIGDLAVDEAFDSAEGGFSSVEPIADITFPDALPSVVELMERIATLEARIAELEAGE